MFGYVIPDKPNMYIKDFAYYKAIYCGMCKSIGKCCGQRMRFSTNYDITFLNAFVHEVNKTKMKVAHQRCILHPFRRRPVILTDELSKRAADVNTLLSYFKILDDVKDTRKLKKKMFARFLRKKAKKAIKREPEIAKIMREQYEQLAVLEKNNCMNIDEAADCFGMIMRTIGRELTGEKYDENVGNIMYHLGRYIYFLDAIDDLEEDFKAKRYNPVIAGFGSYTVREEFITNNRESIEFLFETAYKSIKNAYDKMEVSVCEGVLSNIIYKGLKARADEIIGRSKKCHRIRL